MPPTDQAALAANDEAEPTTTTEAKLKAATAARAQQLTEDGFADLQAARALQNNLKQAEAEAAVQRQIEQEALTATAELESELATFESSDECESRQIERGLEFDATAVPCAGFEDLIQGAEYEPGETFTTGGLDFEVVAVPDKLGDQSGTSLVVVERLSGEGNDLNLRLINAAIVPDIQGPFDTWRLDYELSQAGIVVSLEGTSRFAASFLDLDPQPSLSGSLQVEGQFIFPANVGLLDIVGDEVEGRMAIKGWRGGLSNVHDWRPGPSARLPAVLRLPRWLRARGGERSSSAQLWCLITTPSTSASSCRGALSSVPACVTQRRRLDCRSRS